MVPFSFQVLCSEVPEESEAVVWRAWRAASGSVHAAAAKRQCSAFKPFDGRERKEPPQR